MIAYNQSRAQPGSNQLVITLDGEGVREDGLILGNPDAEKTIIVFSDYECPYCSRHDEALRTLIVEDSTVNVEYHYLPLPMHDGAKPKARFVECVKQSGGDAQMAHYSIFQLEGHADENLTILAEAVGNVERIMGCYNGENPYSKVVAAILQEDLDYASENGIRGTPASIIGDKLIKGAVPIAQILAAFDD